MTTKTMVDEPIACRNATQRDVHAIAAVHARAFPGFFLTKLGSSFLRTLYRETLSDPGGVLVVAEADGVIAGFVAGYRSEREFYRRLKRRPFVIGVSLVGAVLRRPSVIFDILARLRQQSTESEHRGDHAAYLSSIGVDPEFSGAGVGARLLETFCREAAARGYGEVYLTTDADENDRVNRFYARAGFMLERTFEAVGGRRMNLYRKVGAAGAPNQRPNPS